MDLQEIFISNLKRFRKEQHITQEKLAELCDTETSYIGQIETKKRLPSFSTVFQKVSSIRVFSTNSNTTMSFPSLTGESFI